MAKFAHTFNGHGKLCIYIDEFASLCMDCSGVFVVGVVADTECLICAQVA